MDIVLDETELRILGSLIEKEMTTPEYYPLSLNALCNACNQKSNRNPVVSFDEATVTQGLDRLIEKGLSRKTFSAGSRVPKYLHTLLDKFDLSGQEMAVLCELMLRGPQTMGEVRGRAERMSSFGGLEEVDNILQGLMEHDPPLAAKLPRETGRKECRYMHMLSGVAAIEQAASGHSGGAETGGDERILRLEEEVSNLRNDLEELRRSFAEFKSQF